MDTRQILILLNIGGLDVSQKCIDSVSVDRNFSDVGDTFSITLIDSPSTGILYDLELFMASGYRNVTLKYGDISTNKLVGYNGQVLDYTNTFVGNIKKLTITGILNRYVANQEGAANCTYNIDWNSYYNKRADEKKNYGVIDTLIRKTVLADEYSALIREAAANGDDASTVFASSDILDPEFRTTINSNAVFLKIKGPSGNEIQLPIPDSMYELKDDEIPPDVRSEDIDEAKYKKFYDAINDTNSTYWGKLNSPQKSASVTRSADFPTLFGVGMNLYIPKDKYKTLNRYPADKTIIVDKVFLGALGGFKYDSMPTGMVGKAISKEFYDEYLANYMLFGVNFGGSNRWDNPKNAYAKSIYGTFDADPNASTNRKVEMNENITASMIINTDNKIVAVYYTYHEPNQPDVHKVRFGPFVATPNNGGLDDVRRFITNLGYLCEGVILLEGATEFGDDRTGNYYWTDKDEKIRAILITESGDAGASRKFFLQANPNARISSFGGAAIIKSGIGTNISDIVEKLAILEGWKLRRDKNGRAIDIVQTELVPFSESFVMQNQAAMDFIINNLVPKAVTPVGKYYDTSGNEVTVGVPQAGFYPFFDDNGYFHFQPLEKKTIKDLKIPNLGYNLPNSPVISFQTNLKGTAFYTYNPVRLSAINIVTGGNVEGTIQVSDDAAAAEINAARHNDTFDAWLGLTYKDVEKYANDRKASGTELQKKALSLAQNALVTSPYMLSNKANTDLIMSASLNAKEVEINLLNAKKKIDTFVNKATMSMWGNFEVAPARRITVTNMLKGGLSNANYPVKHSSSGVYLILSMQDKIDSGGFIQSLNLVRFSDDASQSLNSYRIDYSKAGSYAKEYIPSIPQTTMLSNTTSDATDLITETIKDVLG